MKETLFQAVNDSIKRCQEKGLIPKAKVPAIFFEVPKRPEHGDVATNVAMDIASGTGVSPLEVARAIVSHLSPAENLIKMVEVAGPGFINFFLTEEHWFGLFKLLGDLERGIHELNLFHGLKVQVEYVSANPTGPLHVGHGRGAAVGDALANILAATGCRVTREYYLNDVGTQMETLGRSVLASAASQLGNPVEYPADGYRGMYIEEIARAIIKKRGEDAVRQQLARLQGPEGGEALSYFTLPAAESILAGIKEDLARFGIRFDNFFSESSLFSSREILQAVEVLKLKGLIYEKDGALWLKTERYGDEKDRVLVRQSGAPTYFASDVAYHRNKFARGFERVIDVWGADHHGYIPRVKAALAAMDLQPEALDVVLVQMVNLLREGRPVTMSTRAGEFVTLKDVIKEVGSDAARFFFLMRRSDSHLDFDLDLAKRESAENPVYYVQYAHARVESILRKAKDRGFPLPTFEEIDLDLLKKPDELALIKEISYFPEVLHGAAQVLEPHRLTFYLVSLAGNFHRYYLKNRVLSHDRALSTARLFLIMVFKTVLKKVLELIGVSAPSRMERVEEEDSAEG